MNDAALFFQLSVQLGTPFLLATLGGIMCEKVGHLNLGIEGMGHRHCVGRGRGGAVFPVQHLQGISAAGGWPEHVPLGAVSVERGESR